MMLLALVACSENEFSQVRLDQIAVVLGDFDNVQESLVALKIATQEYDGFIVQATYEPDDERKVRDYGAPSVEGLFKSRNEKGKLQVSGFNAVFLNSGTRGLGAWRYNNQLEPDNELLLDIEAMDHACSFAKGGGTLVVSDWAYDLVEYCWPDAIEFYGDDLVPDAAQTGMPDDVLADVTDKRLKESLGGTINVSYDYTAWAVIESVGPDTDVLLTGTIEYQPARDELPVSLEGVPLAVRFAAGRGQVVYTTFHWSAQTPQVSQTLLLDSVEGLTAGSGDKDDDSKNTEASGA